MSDAANPVLPDYTSQADATYKANLDAVAAIAHRSVWWFIAHEQATPDMTVKLEAGHFFTGITLTEKATQNTGTITAPSGNPRIDRVVISEVTGVVAVITGAENASPVAPAITAGKIPICQILLDNSPATTAITNSLITDERPRGEVNPTVVSQAAAEAGTATIERIWTAERVKQAIAALATDIPQATQSAIEAETDEDTYIPPDLLKHHPGAAKFWCKFDGTSAGPITPDLDYNVVDVTDNGTGDYTINIDTDFSTADYSPYGFVRSGGGIVSNQRLINIDATTNPTAGAIRVQCLLVRDGTDNNQFDDAEIVSVGGFGDQ